MNGLSLGLLPYFCSPSKDLPNVEWMSVDFKAKDLGYIPLTVKVSSIVIEAKIEPKKITSNNGKPIHVIANQ